MVLVGLMLVGVWCGTAEIYSVVLQVPHHGDAAVVALAAVNALCAWGLMFGFLSLMHDLRELRIPLQRQVLGVVLACIIVVIFLAPCALVASLNGGWRDLAIVAMGSVAGTAAAFLRPWRSPTRTSSAIARGVDAARHPGPATRPTPWRALRTALGPPYAPASWRVRLIQLLSLAALVASAPLLVEMFRSYLSARAFTTALHIAQFAILMPAVALCWVWPLTRVIGLFMRPGGALTELALLPGLGSPRQQLRRLFGVALCAPTGALIALLITAVCIANLEHLPRAILIKLVVTFFLIPLISLPILAGQIVKPRVQNRWSGAALLSTQAWTFTFVLWTGSWDALAVIAPHWRWLIVAVVGVALGFLVGMTLYLLRKLAQRPHPFVEASE